MIEKYVEKIEDTRFQIQFVALSGYSVLELVLQSHEYVRALISGIERREVRVEEVHERIVYLLDNVAANERSYADGSIVVYLYCVGRFDNHLSQEASRRIIDTAGLFWSPRMAYRLLETQAVELAVPV